MTAELAIGKYCKECGGGEDCEANDCPLYAFSWGKLKKIKEAKLREKDGGCTTTQGVPTKARRKNPERSDGVKTVASGLKPVKLRNEFTTMKPVLD